VTVDFNYNGILYREGREKANGSELGQTLRKHVVSGSLNVSVEAFSKPSFADQIDVFRGSADLSVFSEDPFEAVRDSSPGRRVEF